MTMARIDLYRTDDWTAVYFNDLIEMEGHSLPDVKLLISTYRFSQEHPLDPLVLNTYYIEEEEAEKMGYFPVSRIKLVESGIKVIT